MSNKYLKIFFILLLAFIIGRIIVFSMIIYQNINYADIKSIALLEYNEKSDKYRIKITRKKNLFNNSFNCNAKSKEEMIRNLGIKNNCYLILSLDKDYDLYLSHNNKNGQKYKITDFINQVVDFNFTNETVYIIKDEKKLIKYSAKILNDQDENFVFVSSNKDVALINDNYVVGSGVGTTKVYLKDTKYYFNVVVTDLIESPTITKNYKEHVPCNKYNSEEGSVLDKILAYKINEAGYQTRGAVIAAARFLTLEFPYRIPYFYENGRVHKSGVHFVDGEGRYYHKGLYLDSSKMDSIIATYKGPAIWGCPLMNLENEPNYGYYSGRMMSNGLDCSGFVSWALYNAGYDPGDIGAGESTYPYQMTDLGKYTKLTTELINSNTIKTGDLINFWGHIAIIIGIDNENFYVAESLQYFGGVVPKIYKKTKVMDTFTHVVLMDDFYKDDGNYSDMWS